MAGATLFGNELVQAAAGHPESFQQREIPEAIRKLKKMTDPVVPITLAEREARIVKAQHLMEQNKIDAIYIESGTSMYYFTGMRWGGSERMFACVIPQRGELAWVCPKFEEERARELIKIGTDVRTWEEDESPYKRVVQILQDRGLRNRRVGIEERVRFFLFDGIRQEAPGVEFVSATPITAGCRTFKSPAEIALMQLANDITIAAYKATHATMREGMTQGEFAGNCSAAFRALGVQGESLSALVNTLRFPTAAARRRF